MSRAWMMPLQVRVAVVLAVVLAIAACGGESAGPAGQAGDGQAAGPLPITIEHAFGVTTIDSTPQRVVTLGVTDADPVLALGITPVAVTGYSFYESGLGPWAEPLVSGAPPVRIESDSTPSLEQVAALAPDLIVGVSAGFDEAVYEQLSQIAPTLARPADAPAYTVPRSDATRMIAAALGLSTQGDELSRRAELAFTSATEANPVFAGRTGSVAIPYEGRYGVYTPGDARGRFLAELGFTPPPGIAALDPGSSFLVDISLEQSGLLDGDVLVMLADQPAQRQVVDEDSVLQQVSVVADGRMVVPDLDPRGAMTYNSVLSVPYALDRLVPALSGALR